ncbi:helix-turn-helix domain-containing protein [Bradyrhizobium oligotrophicum]|uniref:helix-turn-helix domain-containing protein n=1 Tax=Bradyrhizobium TaxID=374 RepID=UPI003EBDACFA
MKDQRGLDGGDQAWRDLSRMSRPYLNVVDFLASYAQRLAELSRAATVEIAVADLGRIVLSRSGSETVQDWLSERDGGVAATAEREPRRAPEWRLGPTPSVTAPLVYADVGIGRLTLAWEGRRGGPDLSDALADCARQLAFVIKRHEVCEWARQRLGRSLLLVGVSEAVRNLEIFVEKASHSDLPCLLQGEFGTETPYLAAAIHCCGPRRDLPFVQVNCAQPRGAPQDWFRQAEGGTLFFSDIDMLAPGLQNELPQHMHSRLGQWLDVSNTTRVRVIASAGGDLPRMVAERSFSRQLLAELDFLPVSVPPLRERCDDIEPLVIAALEGHGHRAEDKISAEMLDLCRSYPWPENAFEVERVVARLAVMTGRARIRAEDIRRYFPALHARAERVTVTSAAPSPALPAAKPPAEAVREQASARPEIGAEADDWIRHVLNKDITALSRLHPNLRRALLYLVDHYAEPIRLGSLARQAHVSQSHLSFLFRHSLQTSCKAMLSRIRVEKAKELLSTNARQPITDVALQVGFADLSHFEKYFRRQVGRTPREYRRMAAE